MNKYIYLIIVAILLICLMPQFGLNGKNSLFIEVKKEKETSENERFELKEHCWFANLRDNLVSSRLPKCFFPPAKTSALLRSFY